MTPVSLNGMGHKGAQSAQSMKHRRVRSECQSKQVTAIVSATSTPKRKLTSGSKKSRPSNRATVRNSNSHPVNEGAKQGKPCRPPQKTRQMQSVDRKKESREIKLLEVGSGCDTLFQTEKRDNNQISIKSIKKKLLELWVIVIATALICFIISSLFFKLVKVTDFSMVPTLQNKEVLLVKKSTDITRFDLVLFRRGENNQVRRVVGLPGEHVQYTGDSLYIDGELVDEKFIIDEINEAQRNGRQYTMDFQLEDISKVSVIPKNSYLVLGDNRDYGYDSRDYGLITEEQLIGVVSMRVLPLNELRAF